jgi:hypothetical protein
MFCILAFLVAAHGLACFYLVLFWLFLFHKNPVLGSRFRPKALGLVAARQCLLDLAFIGILFQVALCQKRW